MRRVPSSNGSTVGNFRPRVNSAPNRPRSTSLGVPAYSGWYSKRFRSKYCTWYSFPSVTLFSVCASEIGKPKMGRPPYCAQYLRKTSGTVKPVSGKYLSPGVTVAVGVALTEVAVTETLGVPVALALGVEREVEIGLGVG